MLRKTLAKTFPSQFFSVNIKNIDDVFPGFAYGNFAVLYGSSSILPLSMFLCVQAQLSYKLGGLETNVMFIDGGNTFRLYDVSYVAQLREINPEEILERILISRAFTAHQMTSLIFERLQPAVEKHNSRLVIISDIARLYFDEKVKKREARDVFNQLTVYLSEFAVENRVVVIATFLPYTQSRRNIFFKALICGRANVVVSVRRSLSRSHAGGLQFVLEKHPIFRLGSACFPEENLALTQFMEGKHGKNC